MSNDLVKPHRSLNKQRGRIETIEYNKHCDSIHYLLELGDAKT